MHADDWCSFNPWGKTLQIVNLLSCNDHEMSTVIRILANAQSQANVKPDQAISELPLASFSKQVLVLIISYEN